MTPASRRASSGSKDRCRKTPRHRSIRTCWECSQPPTWLRQRGRVPRVEGLDAGLLVAVERRDDLRVVVQAEVVLGRVGEPGAELVEVDELTLAVDERRRERLLGDQLERVGGVAVLVRADVAEVLGGAEGRRGLLEQEQGVVAVRSQVAR